MKNIRALGISVCSIIALASVVSCGKSDNTPSAASKETAFKIDSKFHIASLTSDADSDSVTFEGKYGSDCAKHANGNWSISSAASNLEVIKDNVECKLSVTNIKISKKAPLTEVDYKIAPAAELTASDLIAHKFSIVDAVDGMPNDIYVKLKLEPIDFSVAPKLTASIWDNPELNVININGTVERGGYKIAAIINPFKVNIPVPKFENIAPDFKIAIDADGKLRSVSEINLELSDKLNAVKYSYVLVGDEDTPDHDIVTDLLVANKTKFNVVPEKTGKIKLAENDANLMTSLGLSIGDPANGKKTAKIIIVEGEFDGTATKDDFLDRGFQVFEVSVNIP